MIDTARERVEKFVNCFDKFSDDHCMLGDALLLGDLRELLRISSTPSIAADDAELREQIARLIAQEFTEDGSSPLINNFPGQHEGYQERAFERADRILALFANRLEASSTPSEDDVERVARAVEEADTKDEPNRLPWQDYEHMARAAILAMQAKGDEG